MIREPIISVLGHVDHGKTKFLDKVRGSTIAKREAGKITQHIGATEVPIETIKEISGALITKFGFELNIPGLLFIDTPGHEAFTNLRKRGGSIADLAVLVVDIHQGFQPQTIEAIEILRSFKTPFIVAASKIDKLKNWNSVEGSFLENMKNQSSEAEQELDEKIYGLISELHKHGFPSEQIDRCEKLTEQVPIVPMSSITGEGIPEILMLLTGLSQKFLEKELKVSEDEELKGTILEVRDETGFGTTIDVILYNGKIKAGQEIALGGKNGLIKAKIRALLKPMPLEEMRDSKKKFVKVDEVVAACGVKIAAPGLDEALAGSPLLAFNECAEEKILSEIESVKVSGTSGVVLKTDTLGSLEALTRVFGEKGIPIKKGDIGNVTKHDVMEAESVKQKDPLHGVVIAFNVSIDEHAELEAKKACVKLFSGNVIYSIIEEFEEFLEREKNRMKEETEGKIILPAKAQFLKGFVFRKSKPAIVGVKVLTGRLRAGARLMREDGKIVGRAECLQCKNEKINEAKEGEEIAVSITGATVGRTIEEGDMFYTFIPEKHFPEFDSLELSKEELELAQKIKEIETKAEVVK